MSEFLPLSVLTLGLVVGLAYAALAMGIVLTYKSSRVVNFAHGEVGALAAAVLALLVNDHKVPFGVALVVAVAIAVALGVGSERLVVRRLAKAPRVIVLVATLGLTQLFLFGTLFTTGAIQNKGPGFPLAFRFHVDVGVLVLNASHLLILVLVPLAAIVLALFFRFTRLGVAVRASAENVDSARLAGINVGRVSGVVWAIAAGFSALTGILLGPGKSLLASESMGPGLLLRALAAAVIGKMTSLPRAFAAAVGIGVIEQVLYFNRPMSGEVEVVLFAIVLGGLLMQSRGGLRDQETSSWVFTSVSRSSGARRFGWVAGVGALAVAAAAPAVLNNSQTFLATTILVFAMVALSVTLLTGYAGQISLGQFAFVGLGAAVSFRLMDSAHVPFPVAVLLAAAAGGAASGLIGIPALRVRGLQLGVATLAFALVTQAWLLGQNWLSGSGVVAPRPAIGSFVFDTEKRYYFLVLGTLVLSVLAVRNLTRSGVGRRLVAVRDNEVGAASFAVSPVRAKLTAFIASGTLAALAGAMYGHCVRHFSPETFHASESLRVVAIAVIGGLGSIPGAIAGAVAVVGIERLVKVAYLGFLTTSVGLLGLLLFMPRGLAGIGDALRNGLLRRFGPPEGATQTVAAPLDVVLSAAPAPSSRAETVGARALRVSGMDLAFGGVTALSGVGLSVAAGEVVGIIGPNGAGKTTLFDCICGHVRPDAGRVVLAGRDVTSLAPHARAALGLVRSFQDVRLFPGLTVMDTLRLAQEKHCATNFGGAVLSSPAARAEERRKSRKAVELLELMGLGTYRDKLISELSTGTRRVVELGCMLALEPSVLLLDEPSAGIAQKEVESLGDLLASIRRITGTTMLVIEHDIPLIAAMSDRLVAMESGRVLCEGLPDTVLRDARVVASYLGSAGVAVGR
ncbi:MAG: branched-chain amino acid ABC transporter permease/ATP-binding protein [Actinomycetota bacterium]